MANVTAGLAFDLITGLSGDLPRPSAWPRYCTAAEPISAWIR